MGWKNQNRAFLLSLSPPGPLPGMSCGFSKSCYLADRHFQYCQYSILPASPKQWRDRVQHLRILWFAHSVSYLVMQASLWNFSQLPVRNKWERQGELERKRNRERGTERRVKDTWEKQENIKKPDTEGKKKKGKNQSKEGWSKGKKGRERSWASRENNRPLEKEIQFYYFKIPKLLQMSLTAPKY